MRIGKAAKGLDDLVEAMVCCSFHQRWEEAERIGEGWKETGVSNASVSVQMSCCLNVPLF